MASDPGPTSPFAARARTRVPFNAAASATPAPAVAATVAPAQVQAVAPRAKSMLPWVVIGVVVLMGLGAVVFMASAKKEALDRVEVVAPAPAVVPEVVSAPVPPADLKADYARLSELAGALSLPSESRPDVASATLLASGGAYDEAVSKLGPLVWKQMETIQADVMNSFSAVKLSEHATVKEVKEMTEWLNRSTEAAAAGRWATAADAAARVRDLAPLARAGVARRLVDQGETARQRADLELATYFYLQAVRLQPDNENALRHLYQHGYAAGHRIVAAAGVELAYVPSGTFPRGSRQGETGRDVDEVPGTVTLTRGYFMGVTEVTQRQWDAVFGAGAAARLIEGSPTRSQAIGPELPMHSVTWEEARSFCEKLTVLDGRRVRLPTEAEWEYACRAGTTTAFNTGRDSLAVTEANIDDGSATAIFAPAPVGSVGAANLWGLRDLHGNVWEWCSDWSAPYPSGVQVDPRGPADNAIGRADLAMRVVRGGGWNSAASEARSANRWEHSPAAVTAYLGFRVVIEPDFSTP